jgi:hypothetical protein
MEGFCSADDLNYTYNTSPGTVIPADDMNYTYNTSPNSVSLATKRKEECDVSTLSGGLSVLTTALILTGVLLVCGIGGGLVLVRVLNKRRNIPNTPEYCDVYAPRASYISVHSYAEVGSGQCSISLHSYTDVRPDSNNAAGYSYATVQ